MLASGLLSRCGTSAYANGMVHSGTPVGVPASADCAIRQLAYEQGKKLVPRRGDFKSLFDALQLGACPGASPEPEHADAWAPPRHNLATTSARVLYVTHSRCCRSSLRDLHPPQETGPPRRKKNPKTL